MIYLFTVLFTRKIICSSVETIILKSSIHIIHTKKQLKTCADHITDILRVRVEA